MQNTVSICWRKCAEKKIKKKNEDTETQKYMMTEQVRICVNKASEKKVLKNRQQLQKWQTLHW